MNTENTTGLPPMTAQELLKNYYGIDIICASSEDRMEYIPEKLEDIFHEHITPCINDDVLLETLHLLSIHFQNKKSTVDKDSFKNAMARYIRQDLLRIYVFGNETLKDYNNISIRGKDGAVRLTNCCNWAWADVFKPYIEKNLSDVQSVEQAKRELLTGQPKRGRRPNDDRIPVIIWGTYRLLTDLHGFRTPMPNCLCNFIIRLLQYMSIIPDDTEIDAMWMRSELRYIKAKAAKPELVID